MRNSLRAVFFGLLLAGSASVAAWASPDVFRLGIYADAESLDPIASSDNTSIWTELLIYDSLIRPTKDGNGLEPGLAESWTSNIRTARNSSSSCATRNSRTARRSRPTTSSPR